MMQCVPQPPIDALQKQVAPELFEIALALAGTALFSGLKPDDLARLARGCRKLNYDKGNILFHKGDACHGFYLMLSGQVKLAFISQDGNQKVVEIMRSGQTFGEAVMFMERPFMLMAQALTDCQVLLIAKEAVFAELERDHLVSRKVIASLSMRLHHLINDLEAYSLRSGRERIIGYLLREEESAGQVADSGPVTIRLPTHKATIASRLNLTQEHFSRILHELVTEGLVVVEGRLIHVPDIGRLRAGFP